MNTWISELQKTNPALAQDYKLTGNQSSMALRHMVRALNTFSALNTPEENARLAAAKRILRHLNKQAVLRSGS